MNPLTDEFSGIIASLLNDFSCHIPQIALVSARLVPIVWLSPIFGGRLLPSSARLIITIGLACTFSLPASGETDFRHEMDILFLGALFVESLTGLAIGLIALLPFEIARCGGHITDTVRGASFAQVIAPGLSDRTTPTGDILYLAMLVSLAFSGWDRLIIMTVADSFNIIPAGSAILLISEMDTFFLIESTALILSTALMIAAPVIVFAILTDLILGTVGRIAPQLPLFFLGMPIKTIAGIVIASLALGPVLSVLHDAALNMPDKILEFLMGMMGGT